MKMQNGPKAPIRPEITSLNFFARSCAQASNPKTFRLFE